MWEKVSSRCHKPLKIFPFGPNGDEVMLYGTVDYGLKDGKNASVDWAARAHLVQEEGTVKMDFYQVYLVSLHVSCHNEIPSLCTPQRIGSLCFVLLKSLFWALLLYLESSHLERPPIVFCLLLEARAYIYHVREEAAPRSIIQPTAKLAFTIIYIAEWLRGASSAVFIRCPNTLRSGSIEERSIADRRLNRTPPHKAQASRLENPIADTVYSYDNIEPCPKVCQTGLRNPLLNMSDCCCAR